MLSWLVFVVYPNLNSVHDKIDCEINDQIENETANTMRRAKLIIECYNDGLTKYAEIIKTDERLFNNVKYCNLTRFDINNFPRIKDEKLILSLYKWAKNIKYNLKNLQSKSSNEIRSIIRNLVKDRLNNHKFRGPIAWVFLYITGMFDTMVTRRVIKGLCQQCSINNFSNNSNTMCKNCAIKHCNFYRMVCVCNFAWLFFCFFVFFCMCCVNYFCS